MILFIIELAGAVALLLWAVRLIRTGVERAYMNQLRAGLRQASEKPVTAVGGGAMAAILLQSSTAVAMLATGFAAAGALSPAAGLALILGADVGSAIAAQILLSPVSALIPLLLLIGVALFLKARNRTAKQSGRVLIGLALVFLSLSMIRNATTPLQESELVAMVMGYLEGDPLSAFALGALLAWAMHSSIAAILMFVTFVAEALLPANAAVAMVLGANLGGAAIPVVLTLSGKMVARRMVTGNLILRGGGAILTLLGFVMLAPDLGLLGSTPHRQIINLHLVFNIAVALLAFPLIPLVLRLAGALLTEIAEPPRPEDLSVLDDSVVDDPHRALACAGRELLRMGETVHGMLIPALSLYRDWNEAGVAAIAEAEDKVDRMHYRTKLYIAKVQKKGTTEAQAQRAMDIVTIATNLEDAADQISGAMMDNARKMHEDGLAFSDKGWKDLEDFHDRVVSNSQLALNVLMTGDAESARQLVSEKERIRDAEQTLQSRHLTRLRKRNVSSIETTNIHQDTIRALKQINTDFTLVAYPIAEEAGDLLSSRLARPAEG